MNVRKFIAPSVRDALKKVKETLGVDAIILSNREVPGGVEIMAVAARDMAMIVPGAGRDEVPAAPRRPVADSTAHDEDDSDYTVRLNSIRQGGGARPSAAEVKPLVSPRAEQRPLESAPRKNIEAPRRHVSVNAGIPKSAGLRHLDRHAAAAAPVSAPQPAAAEVIPVEVMEEIRQLRKMVEQHLAGFAWGETARREPVKAEMMRQMLDSGFSPKFSRDLLATLPGDLTAEQALAWSKGAVDRAMLTLGSDADIIDRGGVYALVGPTGVGKTTTVAKLAARSVLRHGPSKVALITTDSYRIGAHEQLRIYGRILGVAVHLVKDGTELRQTLAELRNKHIVLIDTMGMSQRDKLVGELNDMLADCGVKRLLLMPATSRGDTLDDVVKAYAGEQLAGCIVSKVDEAASLASTLDVILRHRLCLHYVANGQRVPEDLHLPNRAYLIHRAFKDGGQASPHHFEEGESTLVMASAGAVAGAMRG